MWIGMLLITIVVEFRVVAGRSRTRAGSPQAVFQQPCCAVALRRTAWSEHGMASVNQTRPHCVNQMGKTHSKPLAARHGCSMPRVTWPLGFFAGAKLACAWSKPLTYEHSYTLSPPVCFHDLDRERFRFTCADWKQIPHNITTIRCHTQHHDSWIPASDIVMNFILETMGGDY